MNKIIELAKKLKALADRGVDGEKVNAEKMLRALMIKHHITAEDIEIEEKKTHCFKYKTNHSMLTMQIIATVTGRNTQFWGRKRERNTMYADVTYSQKIEIEAMIDHYSRAFDAELKLFMSAFIQANRIFPDDDTHEACSLLSDEEKKNARKILAMAEGIEKVDFKKRIKA